MKLDFIDPSKLSVSKANMRHGKKAPDVSDILPTVRARGILVPLMVRASDAPDCYEIIAGRRRFHAACLVAEESGEAVPLPCAILDEGDDAAAIEASLIENLARLDPDEMTQWESFTRLVREGRHVDDIAMTFGLPEPAIRRVLALGNLLPRIRDLYRRETIDMATVRHLTMASKRQQQAWLALYDDPKAYAPSGHQLKAWLFGGQSIKASVALFDVEQSGLVLVADLFGEDRYVSDPDAFWTAQNAAIEARKADYLEAGWSDVMIVGPSEHFHSWEYEKAGKRKGGRVYVDIRANGEVAFHEGYLTRKEARRIERGETAAPGEKPVRPEISGPMQTYIDLHRHAALRAAMTGHPGVALRLMVAHVIAGSPLWTVRTEPQTARNDATKASVETSRAEANFDEKRRAVLALLGFSSEVATVTGGYRIKLAPLFLRLLELPDPALMDVIGVVMGETLAAGSAAVDAVGVRIGLDMADWWQADTAFFELVRDRAVMGHIVRDIAGDLVAGANEGEKAKTLKTIARAHLDGSDGRDKRARWVPRWMTFPSAAYTGRSGISVVEPAETPEPDAEPQPLAA